MKSKMKSKKYKISAIVFYSVIIVLALCLPNMAFALQSGDFTYDVSGGTVRITGYTCPGGAAVIPPTIDGMPVVSIGNDAFSYCTGLTSVTIPDSVTSIGKYAFYYCYGLTSVTIGNSVTSIGESAFFLCSGLTSVIIPKSVTSIGNYSFYGCDGLTKAYFLGNAPSMGIWVFYNCASSFSICYTAGATGFTTPTWYGYPASVCEEPTSSTTTVPSTTTTTVPPTAITIASFTAKPLNGEVVLEWSTETEIDNAGFNLYRATAEDGEYDKINNALIPAQGSTTQGTTYEFIDSGLRNGKTYYYKLEDIDLNGTATMHGPVKATPRWRYGAGK